MTPASPQYGSDSELQADVMRFMAIIAFCLIAILALVRNVTPAEPPVPTEAEAAEPVADVSAAPAPPEPVPEPVPEKEAAPHSIEAAPPLQVAAVPPPVEPAPAEPVRSEPVARETRSPERRDPPALQRPEPAPAPASEPVEPAAEEEGLILRFASDGDFLRLIARGDIQVYAYQERDVLTLGGNYQFMETRAPGQVYELLKGSIPTLVVDALKRSRANVDGYRWGVVLPGRISHQIESYLGQVKHGQLVIDRFGDVHHVAAS